MATQNERGGWDLTDDDAREVLAASGLGPDERIQIVSSSTWTNVPGLLGLQVRVVDGAAYIRVPAELEQLRIRLQAREDELSLEDRIRIKIRLDERERLRRGHELRMGPFHVTCCFNEVEARGR